MLVLGWQCSVVGCNYSFAATLFSHFLEIYFSSLTTFLLLNGRALWVMHVLDERTNIAANLHCLWLIFHLASREDNFTMHSGKFLRLETKQVGLLTVNRLTGP